MLCRKLVLELWHSFSSCYLMHPRFEFDSGALKYRYNRYWILLAGVIYSSNHFKVYEWKANGNLSLLRKKSFQQHC